MEALDLAGEETGLLFQGESHFGVGEDVGEGEDVLEERKMLFLCIE